MFSYGNGAVVREKVDEMTLYYRVWILFSLLNIMSIFYVILIFVFNGYIIFHGMDIMILKALCVWAVYSYLLL